LLGLAPAAPSPASAAAAATTAATASAATPTAASTASASTATSATANNNEGQLLAAANIFPVEEMERGETDVGHFLFAKHEALIGQGIVRLRDIGSGNRGG
jgi:hypothetical protein